MRKGRKEALSRISVLAIFLFAISISSASAFSLIPSEMKGWSWYQSTILGGLQKPGIDRSSELLLKVPRTSKALHARLWRSSVAASGLFLILPGTGGGTASGMSNMLADLVNGLGYDALVLANPFSADFQNSFSSDGVVGLPQRDAKDNRRMLESALELYQSKFGKPRELILLGSSLGALYTLLEGTSPKALPFTKLIALNPPVNLSYGMAQLDKMIQVFIDDPNPLPSFDPDLIMSVVRAQHGVTAETAPGIRDSLPTEAERGSEMIGEAFHESLAGIMRGLYGSELGFFGESKQAEIESSIGALTFKRYMGYAGAVLGARKSLTVPLSALMAQVSLERALKDKLGMKKAYVLTNADDFLLRKDDFSLLEKLFGPRLRVFEAGGHCGNYWTASFRQTLLSILNE
ncbi:MAG: hypothetical protein ACXVBE_17365 [Bdellovibrionota bacterium]